MAPARAVSPCPDDEERMLSAPQIHALQSANPACCDCGDDALLVWASVQHGALLCVRCAGKHRGLGIAVSRVKSLDLDAWTGAEFALVERGGNGSCAGRSRCLACAPIQCVDAYTCDCAHDYRADLAYRVLGLVVKEQQQQQQQQQQLTLPLRGNEKKTCFADDTDADDASPPSSAKNFFGRTRSAPPSPPPRFADVATRWPSSGSLGSSADLPRVASLRALASARRLSPPPPQPATSTTTYSAIKKAAVVAFAPLDLTTRRTTTTTSPTAVISPPRTARYSAAFAHQIDVCVAVKQQS